MSFLRRTLGVIFSSSAREPEVKQEARSEDNEPNDKENANAFEQDGGEELESQRHGAGDVNGAASQPIESQKKKKMREKKKNKKSKRQSRRSTPEEAEFKPLREDHDIDDKPGLDFAELARESERLDARAAEESLVDRPVAEGLATPDAEEPKAKQQTASKRKKKSNGTKKKRSSRSNGSTLQVDVHQSSSFGETHTPVEALEAEDAQPAAGYLSQKELDDLPRRVKKTRKSKTRKASPELASQEKDPDASAVLRQSLSSGNAGVDAQADDDDPDASSQLGEDAEVFNGDEEGEDETPKRLSKKAFGKRKAVDESLRRGSSKKAKRGRSKEVGGRDLRTMGFERVSSPQTTQGNGHAVRSGDEDEIAEKNRKDVGSESETGMFVSPTAKPSQRHTVQKRRLHVEGIGTPILSAAPASSSMYRPKAKFKTPETPKPPRTPKASSKVKLPRIAWNISNNEKIAKDDIERLFAAVDAHREEHNLTQFQVNEIIQMDAKSPFGRALWKNVCEEVPEFSRRTVQNTCRRKFHNFAARGVWTEEQDAELRLVYEKYPKQWKLIGEHLKRFSEDVRDRWRTYVICEDTLKKDTWDIEEEEHLRAAVNECVQKKREAYRHLEADGKLSISDEDLIDWQTVSDIMGRMRNRLQCRNKWKKLIDREGTSADDDTPTTPSSSWRSEKAALAARLFSADEKLALLRTIRDSNAGREGKIPWQIIKNELDGVGKRMAWQHCFRTLKACVPDYEEMEFKDIVATLIDVFETAAPGEPKGYDLPIAVQEPKKTMKKKAAMSSKTTDVPAPKKSSHKRKMDRGQESAEAAPEVSTTKRRRVRDRMVQDSQASMTSRKEMSVDVGEDVASSFKAIQKSPAKKGKRVVRNSKRNQFLSEEKIIESDDEEQPVEPADDKKTGVNGEAAAVSEGEEGQAVENVNGDSDADETAVNGHVSEPEEDDNKVIVNGHISEVDEDEDNEAAANGHVSESEDDENDVAVNGHMSEPEDHKMDVDQDQSSEDEDEDQRGSEEAAPIRSKRSVASDFLGVETSEEESNGQEFKERAAKAFIFDEASESANEESEQEEDTTSQRSKSPESRFLYNESSDEESEGEDQTDVEPTEHEKYTTTGGPALDSSSASSDDEVIPKVEDESEEEVGLNRIKYRAESSPEAVAAPFNFGTGYVDIAAGDVSDSDDDSMSSIPARRRGREASIEL